MLTYSASRLDFTSYWHTLPHAHTVPHTDILCLINRLYLLLTYYTSCLDSTSYSHTMPHARILTYYVTRILLLHSQLYFWPGFIHFGCDFLVCDRLVFFFNPTIEVVTFRLHGWCMLVMFLLPAFTGLGHECQDLLSPCHGMRVCTDKHTC